MPGESARLNGRKGGRPKGSKSTSTVDKELMRELTRQTIGPELVALLLAHVANAKGHKYLVRRDKRTGKFTTVTEASLKALEQGEELEHLEVWEKTPNTESLKELLNRLMDKPAEPPQQVIVTGTLDLVTRLQEARKRASASHPVG